MSPTLKINVAPRKQICQKIGSERVKSIFKNLTQRCNNSFHISLYNNLAFIFANSTLRLTASDGQGHDFLKIETFCGAIVNNNFSFYLSYFMPEEMTRKKNNIDFWVQCLWNVKRCNIWSFLICPRVILEGAIGHHPLTVQNWLYNH